jgi:hypothetical protein
MITQKTPVAPLPNDAHYWAAISEQISVQRHSEHATGDVFEVGQPKVTFRMTHGYGAVAARDRPRLNCRVKQGVDSCYTLSSLTYSA